MERKIGISLGNGFRRSTPEMVKLVSSLGFGAVSPSMPLEGQPFDLAGIAKSAKECGVLLSALHAPFLHAAAIWQDETDDGAGALGAREIMEGIGLCSKYEIPVLVIHAWIGFEPSKGPTEVGLMRIDSLLTAAQRRGVCLAVENTEGEEYLDALLARYKDFSNFGFCYDSGHAHCYNHDRDLLSEYGDRLLFTHLNDNLGVCSKSGEISPLDDLHLLPFDGNLDWAQISGRLAKARTLPVLNFELNIASKPGRHENDRYGKMRYEEYFSEVFLRASRIKKMIESAESK